MNHNSRIPLLVSFSGVDGAGKSTQIENLREALRAAGLRTRVLAFWDDVVVGVKYREGFVHRVFKSERGIGAPGRPVNRRDKNIRHWYLSIARHFLYFLDAIHLCRIVAWARRLQPAIDVIIFDRYLYDELANLNLHNPLSRVFVKLVHRFIPRPEVAYLLDADPVDAYARKPEYPPAFMDQCRQAYLNLAKQLGTMTFIPALSLPEARLAVLLIAEQRLMETGLDADLGFFRYASHYLTTSFLE